jgi:hypothetical protein
MSPPRSTYKPLPHVVCRASSCRRPLSPTWGPFLATYETFFATYEIKSPEMVLYQ